MLIDSSQDPVVKRGEELLRKNASGTNLDDINLINKLFLLFNGIECRLSLSLLLFALNFHTGLISILWVSIILLQLVFAMLCGDIYTLLFCWCSIYLFLMNLGACCFAKNVLIVGKIWFLHFFFFCMRNKKSFIEEEEETRN